MTTMTSPDPLELLTPDEVADLLKVKKDWLYDQHESGKLRGVKLGRQLRYRRQTISDYLANL